MFNLKNALQGEPVVTRDGRTISNIRIVDNTAPKSANDVDEHNGEKYEQGLKADIHNTHHTSSYSFYHDGGSHLYGGENASDLMMKSYYDSLKETEYLLSSKTNAKHLKESIAELNNSSIKKILMCSECFWTFSRTHTDECPQCGSRKTEETDEINQYSWRKKEEKRYYEQLIEKSEKVQCCYKSKHSNGWHHDENCPEHVICY